MNGGPIESTAGPDAALPAGAGGGALASFGWLSVGLLASRAVQFAAIVYLTRALGDTGFGRFAFVQAFLWYGVTLTDLGLSPVGMREVARQPQRLRAVAASIHGVRFLMFLAQMVVLAILLWALPVDAELRWLFVFSFLSLAAYALSPDWAFRGLQRMSGVAAWEALPRVVWLAGCLWLVHERADLLKVPLIRLAGELGTVLLLLGILGRRVASERQPPPGQAGPEARRLLRQALPLGATALLVQIYYGFDVILLGLLKGDAIAGQYGAVYRIVTLLLTGMYLLAGTYQPILARHFAGDRAAFRRHLRRALAAALLMGSLLAVLVAAGSGPLVRMLFGEAYRPAALPLAILIASLPLAYLGAVYGAALLAAGLQGRLLVAAGLAAAVNVAANLVLIPPLGMAGAALAAVLSYAAGCGLQWWYVSRRIGRNRSTACNGQPTTDH